MDECCSASTPESLVELLASLRDSSKLDASACQKLFEACHSDRDYFTVFACLPQLFGESAIKEIDMSSMADIIPFDFLGRLLSAKGDENSENYQDLAVDVLAVIFSRLSVISSDQCTVLIAPLGSLLSSRKLWETTKLKDVAFIVLKILSVSKKPILLKLLLEVICTHLKETEKKLPSLTLMKYANEILEKLSLTAEKTKFTATELWPANLRIVLTRIFRTREIAKDYRISGFALVSSATKLVGAPWFNSEQHFASMLISLTEVELHMLLEQPEEVCIEELLPCVSIAETFMHFVENGDLDDKRATHISQVCQRSVSWICEYLIECSKHNEVKLSSGAEVVLLRLICSFLSIGGAQILDKRLLVKTVPILITIAQRNLTFGDGFLVKKLLENLFVCSSLPTITSTLVVDYLEAFASSSNALDAITTVANFFRDMTGRKDLWYTKEDIERAKILANALQVPDLQEAMENLTLSLQQLP